MHVTLKQPDPRFQGQLPNPGDLFRVPSKNTVYLAVAHGSPIVMPGAHGTTVGVTLVSGQLFRLKHETDTRVGFEILKQERPLVLTVQ